VLDVDDEVTVGPSFSEGSGHFIHKERRLGNSPLGVDLILLQVNKKNCV
jgi:hypothetical protein